MLPRHFAVTSLFPLTIRPPERLPHRQQVLRQVSLVLPPALRSAVAITAVRKQILPVVVLPPPFYPPEPAVLRSSDSQQSLDVVVIPTVSMLFESQIRFPTGALVRP